uniref:Uncharacterized protein n=1 Tax=Cyanistes caeruleus TaxID=156563 RepID=A0A8C0TZG2_CYACU
MIAGLLSGLLLGSAGYHAALGWSCLSIFIRTLRLKLLAEPAAEARSQLRLYLTVAIAAAQPLLMYGLTFHLLR